MSSALVGEQLKELLATAERQVVVIAPFIKRSALESLLGVVAGHVGLTCVTRWHVAEIVAGVSDPEVYESVARRNGELWLRQDLHAKYFRADDRVLLGSANVTNTALGWASRPNLELMMGASRADPALSSFEASVLSGARRVDDALFSAIRDISDLREHEGPAAIDIAGPDLEIQQPGKAVWLPGLRDPADLYTVYMKGAVGDIPTAVLESGSVDLGALQPPEGLTKTQFQGVIAASLVLNANIGLLDEFLKTPRRFGEVRSYLTREFELDRDEATRFSQNLIRWFRYFLSSRYEYSRPGYSEIVVRR